jgi:O-antigen/teichoic acid export membrane protein
MLIKGKSKLIKDLSANTLQTLIVQIFSLLIFYLSSIYLNKEEFGEYSWLLAIATTIFTLLSFGMENIIVKKLVQETNHVIIVSIYFFHTLISSLLVFSLVLLLSSLQINSSYSHPLLLLIFAIAAINNVSSAFKICLIGLEKFSNLAILAAIANIIKLTLVLLLIYYHNFNLKNFTIVISVSSLIELVFSYFILSNKIGELIQPKMMQLEYFKIIRETTPQFGVIICDAALARLDWILLGTIATVSLTADYSFAYRIYESAKLPIIIVTPILLTRFTKLFIDPQSIDNRNTTEITDFFKLELFIVMQIPIVLCCCWTPLMDALTNNKYGAINETTFYLLAICIPIQALSNYLWSIGFAQGQFRFIFLIALGGAIINLSLNLILIPILFGVGAAISFLSTSLFQLFLYSKLIKQDKFSLPITSCLIAFINAFGVIIVCKYLIDNVWTKFFASCILSLTLALVTKQFNYKNIKNVLTNGA